MVKKTALAAMAAIDQDANGKLSYEELESLINPGKLGLLKEVHVYVRVPFIPLMLLKL